MDRPSSNPFALSNLRFDNNKPEIFTVTSGKGGVGKTNVSVNLALLLKQINKNVLLVDADIHLGNVDLVLGLRPKYSIADVLSGKMNMQSIIVKGPQGLDILPASSAVKDLLDMEDEVVIKLSDAFAKFDHQYDMVVVDTGAGIARNVMSFVFGSDKVAVIVTPDPASIADAYGLIKIIKQTNKSLPILIITNMVSNEDEGESLFKKMNLMTERFLDSRVNYGGTILYDNIILDSIKKQKPVVVEYPNSRPAYSLKLITRNMLRLPTKNMEERAGLFNNFISYRNVAIGDEE